MFHGSYLKDDVEFLVKIIDIDFTNVKEKEQLIQSGTSHYSQMISQEYEPTQAYLDVFYKAFELNKERFAQDIFTLASHLSQKKEIVLISLLRAGTPIGVLLKRTLKEKFQKDVTHYSLSIIRDREIDNVALKHILKKHPEHEFIFIDGWTGKGVINRELKYFIQQFNALNDTHISDALYVISDIASVSDFSVTNDDYLIPSSALNSTVSGLVSRSILNEVYIKEGDFHGCKYYKEYLESDLSLWFIENIMQIIKTLKSDTLQPLLAQNSALHSKMNNFLKDLQKEWQIKDMNYIKPGIAESTRVLLRRVPFLVIVQNLDSKEIEHLVLLAKEKKVKVVEDTTLPYKALAIIKDVIH